MQKKGFRKYNNTKNINKIINKTNKKIIEQNGNDTYYKYRYFEIDK